MLATRTSTPLTRAEQNLALQEQVLANLAARLHEAEAEGPAKYQTIAERYSRQVEIVGEATDKVERLRAALDASEAWARRAAELRVALQEEYRARGPQYTILIDELVAAVLHAEQLRQSGREVPTLEMRVAQRTVMDLTAQLQKYTESTKSEAMQTVRKQTLIAVLEVCDRVIGSRQPELWQSLLGEIERQLPAGD